MNDTNEKQWWEDEKYWDKSMFTGDALDPDIEAIIAEAERRKVKEIREAIEKCKENYLDLNGQENDIEVKMVYMAKVDAVKTVLSLDCLKDE